LGCFEERLQAFGIDAVVVGKKKLHAVDLSIRVEFFSVVRYRQRR
jgi:hypothetical protein